LSTLFASAAASYTASHVHIRVHGLASAVTVHGYTTAFWWAAGIFAFGLLLALLIPAKVRTLAPKVKPSLVTKSRRTFHNPTRPGWTAEAAITTPGTCRTRRRWLARG
jgi:hypothetical protein